MIRSVHPCPIQLRVAAGRGADHPDRSGILRSSRGRPAGGDQFASSSTVSQLKGVGTHVKFVGQVERQQLGPHLLHHPAVFVEDAETEPAEDRDFARKRLADPDRAIPAKARVDAYPVQERYGIVPSATEGSS